MLDEKTRLAMQGQVRYLVGDLREQVAEDARLRAELRQEHQRARDAERLASAFEVWLEDVLDQAAVAWVLGCVFVRFCEDNELVDGLWIGGEDPAASAERATQRRQEYLIQHSLRNDRHWLREAFGYLQRLRPTAKLFDKHNPVWRFNISGLAAENLSDFFRRGPGAVSLRSEDLETRFLGDLYQELSAHAKKTYALLQTPEFVEEFILDRTFEPAVREFGVAATKVIDPTCGSGHFLLGAFHRLVTKWQEREPHTDIRAIIDRALPQVTGVDINPFAVAIARFRLLVAAVKLGKWQSLERCPAFPVRVATGDSLLEWGSKSTAQGDLLAQIEGKPVFAYESEDADLLAEYLEVGQYTVVVGNPPYITVSDSARSKLYRSLYPKVCHRQYALTVPFAKRFFDLAKRSDEHGEGAGYVGQITGNAFMKREFGKKLIEDYFAHDVELTEVIDASGAYIPGHGTPTVILIGRCNARRRSPFVRVIVGIRGEPATPVRPAEGKVWTAIVSQIDVRNPVSGWVTAIDLSRTELAGFPWTLTGEDASSTIAALGQQRWQLGDQVDHIGYTGQTNADSVMIASRETLARFGVESVAHRQVVVGEVVRDFAIGDSDHSFFMYDDAGLLDIEEFPGAFRRLWVNRTLLWARRTFSKTSYRIEGRTWWEWHQVALQRLRTPLSIAYGEVATHNHFVLDRGGKVFKQTAPVVKLPEGATEDDHLKLLGVLNSSTVGFWLKQTCFPKGGSGMGRGIQPESWMERFAFNASNVEQVPLPPICPLDWARELDSLAQRLRESTPAAVAEAGVPGRERLAEARAEYGRIRGRMIALQEELDWEVYRLYGLVDEDLTHPDPPELRLGERAFEIVMAQQKVETEWFNRHGSVPVDKPNSSWPADYRELVERRIAATAGNRHLQLIERPECKRRWASKSWDDMQSAAVRDWLLDRLEASELWGDRPVPLSVAQLADRVAGDADFQHVLVLWVGHENFELSRTLGELLSVEWVPYLPAQRYKQSGLRKRVLWERTWAAQRREDAGETVEIDVPPKYTSADFVKPSYWRARGKLDVPKERFIAYPGLGRDTDSSALLGWAGWDHLAQAQALATVYVERRSQEAWEAHRLLPVLAGLLELEPWLHQWYAEEREGYLGSPAQFYTDFINQELSTLSSDRAALALIRGVSE